MKQTITIDHIGIASNSLDEGSRFWRLIGLTAKGEDDLVEDQGVVTRFFPLDQGPSPWMLKPVLSTMMCSGF